MRLIIALACLLASAPTLSDSATLLQSAGEWLKTRTDLPEGTPAIATPDSRLDIPACPEGYAFSLPFASPTHLLARCEGLDWSLYLQISYRTEGTLQAAFLRDLPAGHQLTPADVADPERAAEVAGRFLRSAVRKGQAVTPALLDEAVTMYATTEALARDQPVEARVLKAIEAPASRYADNRRAARATLLQSRSARDLPAGHILTMQDIQLRHSVLTASTNIARGAVVDASNTALADVWGVVPQDVLESNDLPRAVATSMLAPGDLIRRSVLRTLPAVAKGDLVDVTVERNLVSVAVKLRAEENGEVGQRITLVNEESGARIEAAVTGPGTASVR
jgi:flagella basal body P-ring formation protein FlgA